MLNIFAAERDYFADHSGQALDESLFLKAAKVEFQIERWLEILPELKAIFPIHWKEIALDQSAIKLDPDYEQYETYDKAGKLHLVTARSQGELVGYHVSIIHTHLHYKSSLTCFTDIFYLLPEYRMGMTGYKMLKFFRDSVKAKGVQKVYVTTKLSLDVGRLLDRLGFKPIERVYSMVFDHV